MKCLSLFQPYAELVVSGKKSIELRRWNTKFRGRFLVHASKRVDARACDSFGIDPSTLSTGAIVGSVRLCDVKYYTSKGAFLEDYGKHLARFEQFGKSRYGFILKEPRRLAKQIKYKGRLKFFDVALDAAQA